MSGKTSNSRLAIHSRTSQHFRPEKLTEWINEKEIFFINCQERSVKRPMDKSSYLCVYKPRGVATARNQYVTGCKPNIKSNDKNNTFMLFRLIKPKEIENGPKDSPDQTDGSVSQSGARDMAKDSPDQTNGSVSQSGARDIAAPYLIMTKFDDATEEVFFGVKGHDIVATTNRNEASQFHIKHEKDSNYFEILFAVADSSDPSLHLCALVNRRGYTSHPLQLRHDANAWFHLGIHDRLSQSKRQLQSEDPTGSKWLDGNEIFYISCSKLGISRKASYLCIHRKRSGQRVTYSTGSVPSIEHNMKNEVAMLFRLIKDERKQQKKITTEEHPTRSQSDSKPHGAVQMDDHEKPNSSPAHQETKAEVHVATTTATGIRKQKHDHMTKNESM